MMMMMMMDWTLWKVINWWWLNLHDWLVIDRTNMMMTMIEWLAVIWTNKFEQFCFLSLPSSAPDWFFAKRPDSLFCEISSTNISIFCKGLFLWCWKFICSTCPHSWDRNRISIQSKNISNRNSAGSSEAAFNIMMPLQKGVELPSSPLNQYHRVYIWRKYS